MTERRASEVDADALRALVDAAATSRLLIPRGDRHGLNGVERQVLAAITLSPGSRAPVLARLLAMTGQRVRAATADLRSKGLATYSHAEGYTLTKAGAAAAVSLAQDTRDALHRRASEDGR